jgi:hypothetical protein
MPAGKILVNPADRTTFEITSADSDEPRESTDAAARERG